MDSVNLLRRMEIFGNQTVNQLNRWQKVGDITEVPQARLYGGNGNAISTRYLQKQILFD